MSERMTLSLDDGFSNLAFAFEQFQAMLRVCELALQGVSVHAARRSYFLTEIVRLLLQRITCGRCRLRLHLKLSARELRAMQEFTLQAQTAAQTRDFRSQLTSFLRVRRLEMPRSIAEHSGRAEHENSRDQPEAAFVATRYAAPALRSGDRSAGNRAGSRSGGRSSRRCVPGMRC